MLLKMKQTSISIQQLLVINISPLEGQWIKYLNGQQMELQVGKKKVVEVVGQVKNIVNL